MKRRDFLIQTSFLATGAFIPFKKWLPQQEGKFQLIRRNVGTFTERGGTIGWLATDDALVMVDSQFVPSAEHCYTGLKKKNAHKLDLLLNTHHHGDHTSGNPFLEPKADKTVAHKNVPILMKWAAEDDKKKLGEPTTVFEKGWSKDVGDEIVHANYFGRGHTGGDSVIYFEKANIAHVGDLVFNRRNPYTDRPSGASIYSWVNVLDSILNKYPNDTILIFGHGIPKYGITGSKEDVKVMKSYLEGMVEHVENGIAKGLTKEEIVALKTMPGFQDFQYGTGWNLQSNLEVVYAEATGEKWLPIPNS